MKWLALLLALIAVFPAATLLRSRARLRPYAWALVGFLAVEQGPLHLSMALDSWAGRWPGYVYGIEISLVDLVSLALFLSIPKRPSKAPFPFTSAIYFAAVLLATLQATVPTTALFYPWQLVRVYFFAFVVSKASYDDRTILSLMKGIASGLLLAAFQAILERFGQGQLQTHGGFTHQNLLAMVSHFAVFPYFSMLLAGEGGILPVVVSSSGLLLVGLIASRAMAALTIFGYLLNLVISAARRWTPRKGKVLIISLGAMLLISPLIVSSFEDRFGANALDAFLGSDLERVGMAQAASMILADHPLGIGSNQYIVIANSQGYNSRAGLLWTSSGAIVHNLYWLTAAETGYPGLVALLLMLWRPLYVALRTGWQLRGQKDGDFLIGCGVSLIVVYLHSFYEWTFVAFQVQYLFAATIGIIAGVAYRPRAVSDRTQSVMNDSGDLYLRPIQSRRSRQPERYSDRIPQ